MTNVHLFPHIPTPSPLVVSYAEASYFDGYHFQHIAAWGEHHRLQRIEREARRARGGR